MGLQSDIPEVDIAIGKAVMKLRSEERLGSQVKKYYDPSTLYQRVLDSADVAPTDKESYVFNIVNASLSSHY